jgi:hypothetical protein
MAVRLESRLSHGLATAGTQPGNRVSGELHIRKVECWVEQTALPNTNLQVQCWSFPMWHAYKARIMDLDLDSLPLTSWHRLRSNKRTLILTFTSSPTSYLTSIVMVRMTGLVTGLEGVLALQQGLARVPRRRVFRSVAFVIPGDSDAFYTTQFLDRANRIGLMAPYVQGLTLVYI